MTEKWDPETEFGRQLVTGHQINGKFSSWRLISEILEDQRNSFMWAKYIRSVLIVQRGDFYVRIGQFEKLFCGIISLNHWKEIELSKFLLQINFGEGSKNLVCASVLIVNSVLTFILIIEKKEIVPRTVSLAWLVTTNLNFLNSQ